MRVVWTEHAYEQLDVAMAFIAHEHPETAALWLERVLEAAGELAEFPQRGRMVPEFARRDIREIILGPYRLIYRVDPSVVSVIMLKHHRRELAE